jgi:hypothetical protein
MASTSRPATAFRILPIAPVRIVGYLAAVRLVAAESASTRRLA